MRITERRRPLGVKLTSPGEAIAIDANVSVVRSAPEVPRAARRMVFFMMITSPSG